MVEARADARVAIAGSKLPAACEERLTQRFTEAAKLHRRRRDCCDQDRARIPRPHGRIRRNDPRPGREGRRGQADKTKQRFDDFFDPKSKPMGSFREAYIDFTGDQGVSRACSPTATCSACAKRSASRTSAKRSARRRSQRARRFDHARDGARVQRRRQLERLGHGWSTSCRSTTSAQQKRIRIGGYGNLPAVAENGPYNALASPAMSRRRIRREQARRYGNDLAGNDRQR
jgi:hypothetical protein